MSWYLQINLAVVIFGVLALFVVHTKLSSRQKLKIHYMLILCVPLAVFLTKLVPESGYDYPHRKIIETPINIFAGSLIQVNNKLETGIVSSFYKPVYVSQFILFTFSMIILSLFIKTFITYKSIRSTFLYKKINRVKVLVSEKKQSPYSFSFLRNSYVVVPWFLLKEPEQLSMAIKHELQHIRNRDTFWSYMFEVCSSVCFLNPIIYWWKRQVLLDQELACDESLIVHKKVSPQSYANCLVQVADATSSHNIPFGATGMAWGQMKPQLLRRIVKMKEIKKETKRLFNIVMSVSMLLFTVTVFALHKPVTLSLSELEQIVNKSDFNEFPIEVNDQVLAELNRFLSNSKWKEFTRDSISRYEQYEKLINKKAAQYNLPKEIAAIAFIESGFKNLPDRSKSISSVGAGMWQFIPSTAIKYGLVVNNSIDERMDIPKATDAAMRYIASNYLLFKDLRLSMMAYYVGESRVLKDVKQFGTHNPWLLIENGNYKTPYLVRAMAGAILLKYSSLLSQ